MSVKIKSFLIGSAGFFLFAMLQKWIPLHNIQFYVTACAVFVIVTLTAWFIMSRSEKPGILAVERGWSIATIVLLTAWLIAFYINETNAEHPLNTQDLIRRYFPFSLWITLMLLGTGCCLFFLRKGPAEKKLKIRKAVRLLVSLLFTFGTSIQFYAPNIFRDIQGGTYHSHAYTNSIINVCWMVPYSKNLESLYGHYAIFFMPVLRFMHKCFHVDYLTGIFIICALIMGASILLFLYVLNYFAKSDLIFYLGMLAIGEEYFMLMQGGVYLQVHPHRMIFPILLAAFALWEYRTQKKHNILAVCILTCSFVWSTEVGIVSMLSFALFRWIQSVLDGESFCARKMLLLLRELLIYCIIPFVLAYIIINGYNLLAGGAVLDFGEFMFPLISDRDYVSNIELPLPDDTHSWAGATILFMGVVMQTVFRLFVPVKEKKSKKPFFFFLGMMGLGLMLYYINRPTENSVFIILFLMLILEVVILQRTQDVYLEWRDRRSESGTSPNQLLFLALRVITVFLLFVMAFDSVYSMPKAWKKSSETIWMRDDLMEFAQHVYVQIPPDAVSFGEGVPELMSLIDRDTHLHTTEWSYLNMPLDTMKEIREELEGEKWFFCSLPSLYYLQTNYPGLSDQFVLHETFEYNGAEFGFFRKEE